MTAVSVAHTPLTPPAIDKITNKTSDTINGGLIAPDNAVVNQGADVPDCIVQQRHVLAMMGIEVWAQKTQHIVVADYDTRQQELASVASLPSNTAHSNAPVSVSNLNQVSNSPSHPVLADLTTTGVSLGADDSDSQRQIQSQIHSNETRPTMGASSDINTDTDTASDSNSNSTSQSTHSQALHEAQQLEQSLLQQTEARSSKGHATEVETEDAQQSHNQSNMSRTATTPIQVAAFELIGVKYHHWVLLVDAIILKEQSLSLLWNNMLQALSLKPEYLQFPICAGISDTESAAASVAGFVFRVGKSEGIQVAVLTTMPEGARHDALIRLPYLAEMFEDSDKKRQLWQRLSQ